MNKLYKVTIEDENGKIVHQIESDCIMAAISNPKNDTVVGAFVTSCDTNTLANALSTLNGIKKQAYKLNPLLMLTEMVDDEGKKEEKIAGKGFAEFLSKLINT